MKTLKDIVYTEERMIKKPTFGSHDLMTGKPGRPSYKMVSAISEVVEPDEIREVAKEWIKQLQTDTDEFQNTKLTEKYETKNGQEQWVLMCWIKMFFNLENE